MDENKIDISNIGASVFLTIKDLAGAALSVSGMVLLSKFFYESGIKDLSDIVSVTVLQGVMKTLSAEDKGILEDVIKEVSLRPLAPDGAPSKLSKEDWDYVRTPEFKAWFGDWENDPAHSSRCLDEHSEPLVLYHGSIHDFDKFDIGKGGEVTGEGEWEDKERGEKIQYDSSKGSFFSTSKTQAASYCLLGQFYFYEKVRNALEGLYPCVNSLTNYSFHSREDMLSALKLVADLTPSANVLIEAIEAAPEKKILTEIIPRGIPVEIRKKLSDELSEAKTLISEKCKRMSNGGLSNMVNNKASQDCAISIIMANIVRLAHNDTSVKNEFGDYTTHSETIMSGGKNDAYIYFDDDKRCVFSYNNKQQYLDQCDEEGLASILANINSIKFQFESSIKNELSQYGYMDSAKIYKCFLKTDNPLVHDYENSSFVDKYKDTKYPTGYIAARQVRKALLEGNDGVVYKNIRDPFVATTYGVFTSEQVRINKKITGINVFIQEPKASLSQMVNEWFNHIDCSSCTSSQEVAFRTALESEALSEDGRKIISKYFEDYQVSEFGGLSPHEAIGQYWSKLSYDDKVCVKESFSKYMANQEKKESKRVALREKAEAGLNASLAQMKKKTSGSEKIKMTR